MSLAFFSAGSQVLNVTVSWHGNCRYRPLRSKLINNKSSYQRAYHTSPSFANLPSSFGDTLGDSPQAPLLYRRVCSVHLRRHHRKQAGQITKGTASRFGLHRLWLLVSWTLVTIFTSFLLLRQTKYLSDKTRGYSTLAFQIGFGNYNHLGAIPIHPCEGNVQFT